MKESKDPWVQRISAPARTWANCSGSTRMGVPSDQGGRHYGEIFERNVGPNRVEAARGLNNLWNKGGIM